MAIALSACQNTHRSLCSWFSSKTPKQSRNCLPLSPNYRFTQFLSDGGDVLIPTLLINSQQQYARSSSKALLSSLQLLREHSRVPRLFLRAAPGAQNALRAEESLTVQ